MNFTLLQLHAAYQLGQSPILISGKHIHIGLSRFFKSFPSLISISQAQIDLSISLVKFSNYLSPVIKVSQKANIDQSKQTYKSHQTFSSSEIIISQCLFYKIHTQEEGSGFLVNNPDAKVKITKTGFYLCTSTVNAGAFCASCEKITLEKSCLKQCNCEQGAGAVQIRKSKKNTINNNIFEGCSGDSVVTFSDTWDYDFHNSNFSRDHSDSLGVLEIEYIYPPAGSPQNPDFLSLFFSSCKGAYGLYCTKKGADLTEAVFTRNNFERASIGTHQGEIVIRESYFIQEKSRAYGTASVFLNDCFFSDASKEEAKIGEATVNKGTFDHQKMPVIAHIDADSCWQLLPFGLKISIGAIIGITLCCLIAGLIIFYIVRKFCCRHYMTDSIPLIYTV